MTETKTVERTQKLEKVSAESSNGFQECFRFQFEEGENVSMGTEERQEHKKSYINFWNLMVAETEKAKVGGEPCIYDWKCSGTDLNCLDTKTKHCTLYRMFGAYSRRADHFEGKIREAKEQSRDVSQLVYYVELARDRISEEKFRNVRIYFGIINRKLNELEEQN